MRRVAALAVGLLCLVGVLIVPEAGEAVVPGGIGRIVFVSNTDHIDGEIYVREFAGNTPVRLTNNTAGESEPAWSPDGRHLAFSSRRDGNYEIYVMNADGSNQTNLSNNLNGDWGPAWSPHGSQIAFSSDRDGGQGAIYVMDADGSNVVPITGSTPGSYEPNWSPDGTKIVYSSGVNGGVDVYVMNADGSDPVNLTNITGPDESPAWSPDGTKIVFASWRDSNPEIYVMEADGSSPVNLTNHSAADYAPAWSPDGSKIAFQSDRDGDNDIWIMNPDGSNVHHLTDNPNDERSVDFEAVNRPPKAANDKATVDRGGLVDIDLLGNDSDLDGDTLTVVAVTDPQHGLVDPIGGGLYRYVHDGSTTATTDSFVYDVSDGTAVETATVTITVTPAFDDVPPGSLFHGDIGWLAGAGITKGCNPPNNTLYCPNDHVTRGQMAAFLHRALEGVLTPGNPLAFLDTAGSVFAADIEWLSATGVTKGCNPPNNTLYCPNDFVTRGQMAAFLRRALE